MKYFITLITIVSFNLSSAQLKKINNYSLGILYENVKKIDYEVFRTNCKSYVGNQDIGQVMLDYVIENLDDDERNNNTLKRQIRIKNLAYQYQEYIDRIIAGYHNGINYFANDREQCSQGKYIYFNNKFNFPIHWLLFLK